MASSISRCDASGSCSPVRRPSTTRTPRSGVTTRSVQPAAARTTPSRPAADSTARTAVVPTATTRPPPALAALISRADASGTSNRSGYGGSCDSADATPVCSVMGANCTPC